MENNYLDLIYTYFGDFTETQKQQLEALYPLYLDWNSKINVISRKDIDSLYLKHVLHSLAIAAYADFPEGSEIIDIGCGGGFPSIPLAIFFPKAKFHAVDSIGKKLKVVEGVAEGANITNITTQHSRAEEIKDRKFDFVVSRAVTQLATLWKWSRPLLRRSNISETDNGLICLKGGDLAQEIYESGLRPYQEDIHAYFPEEYFEGKTLLHVPYLRKN